MRVGMIIKCQTLVSTSTVHVQLQVCLQCGGCAHLQGQCGLLATQSGQIFGFHRANLPREQSDTSDTSH